MQQAMETTGDTIAQEAARLRAVIAALTARMELAREAADVIAPGLEVRTRVEIGGVSREAMDLLALDSIVERQHFSGPRTFKAEGHVAAGAGEIRVYSRPYLAQVVREAVTR